MEQYIDLDVSLKETHLCVVDAQGGVLAPGARGDASRAAGEGDRPLGAGGACRRTGDGRTVELAANGVVGAGDAGGPGAAVATSPPEPGKTIHATRCRWPTPGTVSPD